MRLSPTFVAFLSLIILASAPALGYMLIAWGGDATGQTLNTIPMSVALAFIVCGALAPFTTPLAVVIAVVVSFLKSVSIRQKLFCWLVTLGAVAATVEILRTFSRMGN